MSRLPILFEDAEALVIDKPAGLPISRPRAGGPCLEDWLDDLRLGFHRPPAPVHRIDTDTSGCLLLARNPRALAKFSAAFEARQVEKHYLGVIAGELADAEGVIELALAKISSASEGWRMIAAKKGKPALTRWQRLAVVDGLTLVAFQPETGRTHQIRVHAALGLGAALLGDPVYGTNPARGAQGAGRTMLHAAALAVPRPGKPPVTAKAPLPADFVALGFADVG
jgi:tRNA pseudouridine32 synthase/23S rRNA pseudouridine746 synthase